MLSLLTALGRAVSQLLDPAILKVIVKSLLITVALVIVLGTGLAALLDMIPARFGPGFEGFWDVLIVVGIIVLSGWLLFRIIALAVLQFFGDDVVLAVEAKYYPQTLAHVRKLSWREECRNSLRSIGRALLVNAIALLLAIPLFFTGIGPALVFFAANAWLLGRELQDLVWLPRRAPGEDVKPIPAISRFLLGATVVGLMVIPILQLLAPLIGAAAATHLVHRRQSTLEKDHDIAT